MKLQIWKRQPIRSNEGDESEALAHTLSNKKTRLIVKAEPRFFHEIQKWLTEYLAALLRTRALH